MSTYDVRLAALEKEVAVMKQDIIYKLDDTNSAVTIIKGVTGRVAQDVKVMRSQLKTMDLRLEGLDMRLARLEEQQNEQGQDTKDIKHRLGGIDQRFDGLDQRFDSIDERFDQVLQALASLTNKAEQ